MGLEVNKYKKENTRQFGLKGEKIAAQYLKNKGYKIIDTNWHAGRLGEIDIIAKYKDEIVFCEIKTRRNIFFGPPLEAITKTKLETLKKLAVIWVFRNKNQYKISKFRIDAIGIVVNKNKSLDIQHIISISL